MTTVEYFTKRHLKCASRLPGRALRAAFAASEDVISMTPSRIAQANSHLQSARKAVDHAVKEVRENVGHITWLVEANFSDKHVTVEKPHPLIAS